MVEGENKLCVYRKRPNPKSWHFFDSRKIAKASVAWIPFVEPSTGCPNTFIIFFYTNHSNVQKVQLVVAYVLCYYNIANLQLPAHDALIRYNIIEGGNIGNDTRSTVLVSFFRPQMETFTSQLPLPSGALFANFQP